MLATYDTSWLISSQDTTTPCLFPPHSFFPSVTLNLAEAVLRNHESDRIAIHFVREGKPGVEQVSWDKLRSRTRNAYDAMVNSGIKAGDKVAVVMSNSADTIVLCLATLAIGAVWSSASPELGIQAIIDRYSQIQPKVIFVDDGYVYAGKKIALEERIVSWSRLLKEKNPNLQDVVIMPYSDTKVAECKVTCGISWKDFSQRGTGMELSFLQAPFGHAAFIVFSSGTVCFLCFLCFHGSKLWRVAVLTCPAADGNSEVYRSFSRCKFSGKDFKRGLLTKLTF